MKKMKHTLYVGVASIMLAGCTTTGEKPVTKSTTVSGVLVTRVGYVPFGERFYLGVEAPPSVPVGELTIRWNNGDPLIMRASVDGSQGFFISQKDVADVAEACVTLEGVTGKLCMEGDFLRQELQSPSGKNGKGEDAPVVTFNGPWG